MIRTLNDVSLKLDFHAIVVVVRCSLSKSFRGDFFRLRFFFAFRFGHDMLEMWVLMALMENDVITRAKGMTALILILLWTLF